MLLLTSTSDKLRLTTGTTADIDVQASYADYDGATTVTPGRRNTAIASATTTDIVTSPGSSVSRNIKAVCIRNKHASTSNTITVIHTDGTTAVELIKYLLLAGEEMVFTEQGGWQVIDVNGSLKTVYAGGVLLKTTLVTTSGAGTWTPDSRCVTALVECVGAGGQGGGAATSSTQVSVGSGGGGGAYAASKLSGSAIKSTSYSVGAKGSGAGAGATGTSGADTTWDTTVIVAKGGVGGTAMTAGTTHIVQTGGAGGASGSCTGDVKISGGMGDKGVRLSASQGWSGNGGAAAMVGACGANGVVAVVGGTVGTAAATGAQGSAGSGAATISTAQAGGAGQDGYIRITEFM